MKKLTLVISILIFTVYSVDSVKAQTTFTPIDDAMVSEGNEGNNYGNDELLIASDYSLSNIREAYLKFDLGSVSNINSIKLRLTPALDRNIEKVVHVSTNDNWTEESISWNNKPVIGSEVGSISTSTQVGNAVEISLDANEVSEVVQDGKLTLVITNTNTRNTFSVESKENSNPPQLIVSAAGGGTNPTSKPGGLSGDANGDGKVDGLDYVVWITNYNTTTNQGAAKGDFDGSGFVDGLDYVAWLTNYGTVASPTPKPQTPTPTVTATPTQKPATSTPTATPKPATPTSTPTHPPQHQTPGPTETPSSSLSEYGVYPNCIPPAIPVESQAWWHEKDSPLPGDGNNISQFRHVHMGMCSPNARTVNGKEVVVNGDKTFAAAIILHNNPGKISWTNMGVVDGYEDRVFVRNDSGNCPNGVCNDGSWKVQSSRCVGSGLSCVTFEKPLSCPKSSTCRWVVPFKTHIAPGGCKGLCESRMKPNMTGIDPRNDRQFTTNNFQLQLGGSGNYRNSAAPIGRGWYTGLEYSNAAITNYMDLYNGRTDISIPVVKGQVELKTAHSECSGSNTKSVFNIDMNAHHGDPGIEVYSESGCVKKTVTINSNNLSNGIHALVLSTFEDNEFGTNVGLIKYLINVQN